MNIKSYQFRVLFLQVIVTCLFAVNVHAAAHLGADSVDCKFCSTHHDPPDAIIAVEASGLLLPATPKQFEKRIAQLWGAPCFSVQQRGPPLSDS